MYQNFFIFKTLQLYVLSIPLWLTISRKTLNLSNVKQPCSCFATVPRLLLMIRLYLLSCRKCGTFFCPTP